MRRISIIYVGKLSYHPEIVDEMPRLVHNRTNVPALPIWDIIHFQKKNTCSFKGVFCDMDTQFSFFDTAQIHIQGKNALLFKQRRAAYATYSLIGFGEIVTLRDYRNGGLEAIDHYLTTGKTECFPQRFNSPALVRMSVFNPYSIEIELLDTQDSDPPYRLWANVGIRNNIPVYHYSYKRIQVMDNDCFAFLALYERSPVRFQSTEVLEHYSLSRINRSHLASSPTSCPK